MKQQEIFDLYNNAGLSVQGVYHMQHQPGHSFVGPTVNEQYAFVFTLSGKGRMQFNDAKGVAQKNTVFHGGPNCWHEYETMGKSDWDIVIIAYDILGPQAKVIPASYSFTTYQSPQITSQLIQMQKSRNLDQSMQRMCVNSIFNSVLFEAFSHAMSDRDMDAHALFSRIVAYIQEHCTQDLDMHSVAQHFGITENRLYYLFHKFSDTGPAGYLNHCRMTEAAKILRIGGIAVEDVALMVGYSDGFSFSKQFKKRYGIAPSYFQKQWDCGNGHVK